MNRDVCNIIKKYGKMLESQEYSVGKNPQIFLKINGRVYANRPECDFNNLKEEDVLTFTLEMGSDKNNAVKLLLEQDRIRSLVISNTPYCQKCREAEKEIEACLDDMAQIIGPRVKIARDDFREIRTSLKHSEGCFVRGKYTITAGRTPYEAVVALTVLEKAAEVQIKAEKIGGGRKIPIIEAKLMRFNYKKKYSKAESEIKEKEVSGI